tara:strand:- start:4155 stop:4322 length:168 start_codon:yes stop_codon:yes gene_type:complete
MRGLDKEPAKSIVRLAVSFAVAFLIVLFVVILVIVEGILWISRNVYGLIRGKRER